MTALTCAPADMMGTALHGGNEMSVLALDFGGTALKYAYLNEKMKFLKRGEIPSPRSSEEEFMHAVGALVKEAPDQLEGIGISMAGKLDPKDGLILCSNQYPFFNNRPLAKVLEEAFHLHVTVQNDAQAAAIAEMKYGVLKDVKNALVIIMGTGIGGAVILDRHILQGSHFRAAEFSLMRVQPDFDLKHCWYAEGGGAIGLIHAYKKRTGKNCNGREIFALCEENYQTALDALQEYCHIAAVEIYNLQSIFDTDVIAIGGGISAQPSLITGIRSEIDHQFDLEEKMGLSVLRPEITACAFHNDANLIGAWADNRSR
jgi:predicted NBD/HSP70 family sugar kinase